MTQRNGESSIGFTTSKAHANALSKQEGRSGGGEEPLRPWREESTTKLKKGRCTPAQNAGKENQNGNSARYQRFRTGYRPGCQTCSKNLCRICQNVYGTATSATWESYSPHIWMSVKGKMQRFIFTIGAIDRTHTMLCMGFRHRSAKTIHPPHLVCPSPKLRSHPPCTKRNSFGDS